MFPRRLAVAPYCGSERLKGGGEGGDCLRKARRLRRAEAEAIRKREAPPGAKMAGGMKAWEGGGEARRWRAGEGYERRRGEEGRAASVRLARG